jgi:hypothetical protein
VKIRILESAKRDLKEGFYFYERQKQDSGIILQKRCCRILSLSEYLPAFTAFISADITVSLQNAFPLQYIMLSKKMKSEYTRLLTAGKIPHG